MPCGKEPSYWAFSNDSVVSYVFLVSSLQESKTRGTRAVLMFDSRAGEPKSSAAACPWCLMEDSTQPVAESIPAFILLEGSSVPSRTKC